MTKTKSLEARDYPGFARNYRLMKPYAKQPNGCYRDDVKCVMCHTNLPVKVFFPCQHKCVCDQCITAHGITTLYDAQQSAFHVFGDLWYSCPVCIADIMLILPNSGKEEQEYWAWVNEVKPPLPLDFAKEFRQAAKHLRKTTQKNTMSLVLGNQQRSSSCAIS